MIIYVKNMICLRCKIVVSNILSNFGIKAADIKIGVILLNKRISNAMQRQLDAALKEAGLELIFDKKTLLVQKIKNIVFEIIYHSPEPLVMKFSCYLSDQLNYNYVYLSGLFKKTEGMTIERYIIEQKMERVKAMLITEGASLSDIAYRLNYSSVGHLSAQFKKTTGYTAREYKSLRINPYLAMPARIAV
jgi:YesN/AraC family two-component response regulator